MKNKKGLTNAALAVWMNDLEESFVMLKATVGALGDEVRRRAKAPDHSEEIAELKKKIIAMETKFLYSQGPILLEDVIRALKLFMTNE